MRLNDRTAPVGRSRMTAGCGSAQADIGIDNPETGSAASHSPRGAHVASDRPQTASYGSWKSPITSSRIAEQSIGVSEPLIDGDAIYWLEQRPKENRYVIVRRWASGGAEDILPPPYSARTRVHEYGG